ncbi:MAG TPA: diguanylate cyclase, partial [Dongiaceae bacterium]|nr:diguanylate cyclase [Dongiaceae bacterium]
GEPTALLRDGLWLRLDQRAAPFRQPAFPFTVVKDHRYRIYLRVQSETALQVPAQLMPEDEFLAHKEADDLLLGLFLGVLVAMMLYNVTLYFSARESAFLLYGAHVLALLFFIVAWQGLGATWFWPGQIGLQSGSIAIATFLAIGFSTWFCSVFLHLDQSNFHYYRLFVIIRWLSFGGALLTPLMPVQWAVVSSSALSAPAVVLVARALLQRSALQERPARLFALGWALYVTGAFMMGLNKFGFIEVTPASENLLLWSSVFDMVLLCIALGDRHIQERNQQLGRQANALEQAGRELEGLQMRLQREQAAQAALSQELAGQESYGRELEQRNRARQLELNQLQHSLEQASEADSLTGLKNRHYFADRLQEEIQRSRHLGSRLSLLLVDIDHFSQINDTYGHLAGDECLRQTAEILRQQLKRPADILCRTSGEQFCALLPDTPRDGAVQLAEQMRMKVADCPMLCAGMRVMVTVSVGVLLYEAVSGARAEQLLDLAGRALQQAKANGRNCVSLAAS